MNILNELRDYLKTKPALRDAFSHPDYGFRCYASRVPQGVPNPSIQIEIISQTPRYLTTDESRCVESSIEVAVYADKQHVAYELLEMIRLAPLSAYVGMMGDAEIKSCTISSESINEIQPTDGSDRWEYEATADYTINYIRPQPVYS